MKADYRLAIISLFWACAILGVMPFAVYRFLTGAYAVAALDAAVAISIFIVLVWAWRTGHTRGHGYVIAGIQNIGVMLSALLLGGSGLLWLYSVLLANFFLLPTRLAAVVAALEIAVLALHGGAFDSTSHMAAFVMSAMLLVMLAYILADWTGYQREQLEMLAAHDALTGLWNRRAMEQDLQKAIHVSDRTRADVGVAVLDIDRFKQVNDRHGHAAGDDVLVAFAELLRRSVRKVDGVYRMGGEEFLVLLPGADEDGLSIVTETLRAAIASELRGPEGYLTASIGAAALHIDLCAGDADPVLLAAAPPGGRPSPFRVDCMRDHHGSKTVSGPSGQLQFDPGHRCWLLRTPAARTGPSVLGVNGEAIHRLKRASLHMRPHGLQSRQLTHLVRVAGDRGGNECAAKNDPSEHDCPLEGRGICGGPS